MTQEVGEILSGHEGPTVLIASVCDLGGEVVPCEFCEAPVPDIQCSEQLVDPLTQASCGEG